ncbi:hypothetical protein DSO57_1010859 [Entomophthora muscae]|uniref:Uncharacterized protein n=1 Tax=Entomophthora muscae TaxID=34485 RepID=A0ACC2TUK1_9FUNG|nr:hypothetical protein DSO57_1010859 [Entomophthora muscae]
MLCSISGEIPHEPVSCIKTGYIFEKRLILKYLAENDGKCPLTNQPLTEEDFLTIKQVSGPVAPRPPTLTSVPSLLSVFQNEWDSLMLETFTLKQQYQQVRQQLSHALYQNDSSARVIARLLVERDEARQALADLKSHIGTQEAQAPSGSHASQESPDSLPGISASIIEILDKTSRELSKGRKKRSQPEGYMSAEQISAFGELKTVSSLHSSGKPGIKCIQLNDALAATGGVDGNIQIYNLQDDCVVSTFAAHPESVENLVWDNSSTRIFSTGTDNVVRCWNSTTENDFSSWGMVGELPAHNGHVTSFSLNPCKQFAASTSLDSTWRFYDIYAGQILASLNNPTGSGYTCGQFHPDGALFGAGTQDSTVQIWTIKDQSKAADFTGHTGAIISMSFSENGYFLATTSESNEVKLWDLRKLVNFETLSLPSKVTKVQFDSCGSYLAAACEESVTIYKAKSWNEPLVSLATHASDLAFTSLSSNIVTVSSVNSNLRVFGVTN